MPNIFTDFFGSDDPLIKLARDLGINVDDFVISGPSLDFEQPLGLTVGAPNVTISPEAMALVDEQINAARSMGNEDLMRLAIEAAGGRGLNLSDTPISGPLLRSKALFESQLGGERARQLLGLSTDLRNFLQRQATEKETAVQNRFRGGLERERFLGDLSSRAFQNRLNLAGTVAQTGINLSAIRNRLPLSQTQISPINFSQSFDQLGEALRRINAGLAPFIS